MAIRSSGGATPPGDQFYLPRPHPWEVREGAPHVFQTVPLRTVEWEPGRAVLEWDASDKFAVRHPNGAIVHGGMVAMVLDTALAAAAMTVTNSSEVFFTIDMRVEFLSPAKQGRLLAEAQVIRRTRQVIFCGADLRDRDGVHLAVARGTQLVKPRRIIASAEE